MEHYSAIFFLIWLYIGAFLARNSLRESDIPSFVYILMGWVVLLSIFILIMAKIIWTN